MVVVPGGILEPGRVVMGVPQGSILRPIIFLIFTNDLPESFTSSQILYDDYTSIAVHADTPVNIVTQINSIVQEFSN